MASMPFRNLKRQSGGEFGGTKKISHEPPKSHSSFLSWLGKEEEIGWRRCKERHVRGGEENALRESKEGGNKGARMRRVNTLLSTLSSNPRLVSSAKGHRLQENEPT
ncbi:hypothetical protein SUGI_0434610 [Cryptomeria japonica]|nr:hypothetical protein SUGI_0434610 [Cryptomeria japonica]